MAENGLRREMGKQGWIMTIKRLQHRHILAISSVIAFLAIAALLLYALKAKNGRDMWAEGMSVKEITGSTVEERLAKYVDVDNAVITKIEDASALQQRYSAIFKDAKDGQYIVETPDAIILYDFEHDRIVQRFEFRRVTIS